jgi:hypothetical protein
MAAFHPREFQNKYHAMQFYHGELDYLRPIIISNEEAAANPNIIETCQRLQRHYKQWKSREDYPHVRGGGMADQQYFERSEPCGYSIESIEQFLARCGVEYNELHWGSGIFLHLTKPEKYDDLVSGHNKFSLKIYPYDPAKAAHVVVTDKNGFESDEYFDTKGMLFDILKKYIMFEEQQHKQYWESHEDVRSGGMTDQQYFERSEPCGYSIESIEQFLARCGVEYIEVHWVSSDNGPNRMILRLTKPGKYKYVMSGHNKLSLEIYPYDPAKAAHVVVTDKNGLVSVEYFDTKGMLFDILKKYIIFEEFCSEQGKEPLNSMESIKEHLHDLRI